jgi:hypothetical protein
VPPIHGLRMSTGAGFPSHAQKGLSSVQSSAVLKSVLLNKVTSCLANLPSVWKPELCILKDVASGPPGPPRNLSLPGSHILGWK